jgi:serine/threonine protein kinase
MPTGELPTLESSHALEAVPGYTLVRLLGEGTLARAYECRHDRSGEIVILKVINAESAADRGATQKTLRENRVVSGLRSHPHIARVIDVGEAAAGPYVAFEKLKGTDLRSLLVNSGRLPVADALAAVRDAARALDAAAHVGVAHRDVKPSNLFRLDHPGPGEGSVKLTDFGFAPPLAKIGGPVGVYGTPAFIAPELLKGAPADVRTDIYALGATLFQLVTARPLFEGNTADVLAAHQKKPVPSIATMVPDAGLAIVDVIYRLLNKDPAKRPQTAAEVVALLEGAMGKQRTSTSTGMVGVGTPATGSSPPVPVQARGPAPSEPQWPTMDSAKLPRPPSRTNMQSVSNVSSVPQSVSSPFDAPAPGEESNPYTAQPTGVLGTLKQMGVTDILQMLEIGKKNARLEVQIDGGNAVVQVHDGQIVFARIVKPTGGVVADGEAAVVALCRKKDGFFRIHYERENTERNVTKPTQFVLLEAMRQIDEKQAAEQLEDPPVSGVQVVAQGQAQQPSRAPPSSPPTGRPSPAPVAVPRQALPNLATPLARPGVGTPGAPPAAKAPASSANLQAPASTWPEQPTARHDRAREVTQSGSAPRPISSVGRPVPGDGIQRDDSTQAVETLDDPTMPEAPTSMRLRKQGLDGAGVLATVQGLAARVVPLAQHALDVGRNLYRRAVHALEPLRPKLIALHPRLEVVPPIALVAAALSLALIVALLVGRAATAAGTSLSYVDGVEAIFDGDAVDVVDELEAVSPADRTLDQDLVLGHAHAALREDDRALELYRIALPLRADPIALAVLTSRLDASAPDEEIDLLVLWPDGDADERLAELTLDPRPLVRMNAAAILVERGTAGLVDVEQTALLDFVQARSCGERRIALATLRAAGKTQAVLDTVDRVGRGDESCFGGNELRNAYASIRKRVGP